MRFQSGLAWPQLVSSRLASLQLGSANLALVSLYFAPVWGVDAVRALLSPYGGFEDRAQAAAAVYVGRLFDFGLEGLMRTSSVLAGIKLVIAVGFVAYLIEFARSLAVGRAVDRNTLDAVLLLAVGAIAVWALPPLALKDAALIRLCASQLVLVAGAVVVILIERQIEQSAQATPHAATVAEPARGALAHSPNLTT
jgi:hypothetical protein